MPGLRRGSFSWKYSEKFDPYFSDKNLQEYRNLVDTIGSCQIVDTGSRFRFNRGCYIGNRTALDFSGTTMRTINLDSLTYTSKTISVSRNFGGNAWRFGENRVLTNAGILDFEGNVITSFSFAFVIPGDKGIVRGFDDSTSNISIYKGVVSGDTITFTDTNIDFRNGGNQALYNDGYLLIGNYGNGTFRVINGETLQTTDIDISGDRAASATGAGPDGNFYFMTYRNAPWGKLYKFTRTSAEIIGTQSASNGLSYGRRTGKFIGNFMSGGMNSSNGTGNGYGSNNYFIENDGTYTLVQTNALAYDTNLRANNFIDEKGRIYTSTTGGGSGAILKTDKTFTNLNWRNPYLFR